MRNGTPGIPCSPCLKKRTRPFTWRKIRGGTAPACTSLAPGNWKGSDSPRAAAGFLFAAIARLSFYRHHRAFFLPSSRGLLFTVVTGLSRRPPCTAFFLPSSRGFLFTVITGLSFCHHRAVSFLPSSRGLLFTVITGLSFCHHCMAFFLPSSQGFLFAVIAWLSFYRHCTVSFLPSSRAWNRRGDPYADGKGSVMRGLLIYLQRILRNRRGKDPARPSGGWYLPDLRVPPSSRRTHPGPRCNGRPRRVSEDRSRGRPRKYPASPLRPRNKYR